MNNNYAKITYLKNIFYVSACFVSLLIGLYIRIRGIPSEMLFAGDQGQDLLVALRIVQGEFYPLVGPVLNVNNFFTPPTYYYILALLMYLFKSEVGIIFAFIFMNIASGIFFALYVKNIMGKFTAVLFFSFYMTTYYSVIQSRSIWQPFPVAIFVALSLWLISKPDKKVSILKTYLSAFLFAVAVSIYPSTVILIPFYLYQIYRVFKLKFGKRYGFIISLASVVVTILILFVPWIISESQNGFPTFYAITQPTYLPVDGPVSRFLIYDNTSGIYNKFIILKNSIYRIVNPYRWPEATQEILNFLFLSSFSILFLIALLNRKISKEFRTMLFNNGFVFIFVGLTPLFFFETTSMPHKIIILVPILFLIIAWIIRLTFTLPNPLIKIIGCLLSILILGTVFSYKISYFSDLIQTSNSVNKLYTTLKKDIGTRTEPLSSYEFRVFNNQIYYYETQPLWYLLKKKDNYQVRFNIYGNDTDRYLEIPNGIKYIYFICFPDTLSEGKCQDLIRPSSKNTVVIKHFNDGLYSIYLAEHRPEKQ